MCGSGYVVVVRNERSRRKAIKPTDFEPTLPENEQFDLGEARRIMASVVADDHSLAITRLVHRRLNVADQALTRLDDDEVVHKRVTAPHLGPQTGGPEGDAPSEHLLQFSHIVGFEGGGHVPSECGIGFPFNVLRSVSFQTVNVHGIVSGLFLIVISEDGASDLERAGRFGIRYSMD